ncbi:MAG: Crp/Fnr family transcriptional regulator [Candidatus Cohnella colombiensis]|uniref:Crp/Fnr family transcriptional regulator n=1 Tax=Candidatus Cohnella colombiensis TaxID=3121368 RepID=A0AA95JG31_9BACL|nr:MAG: Crp/Fnr family transcriptional regulator [Cohnella sp.]
MINMPLGDSTLRNTTCFSTESFIRLSELMHDKRSAVGMTLFIEGDLADKLFYVKKGRVKMTKSSPFGKQITLCQYMEGDLFGQIDPFTHSTHSFTGEALEDTIVGVIEQKELEDVLAMNGELAIEFMRWMGMMHRITQTKFRDLVMFGKPTALCSTLIRFVNSYGIERDGKIVINRRISHTEIAEMIGATRESVNRMLSDLREKGIVTLDRHLLVIHDIEYLRDICHCENCPADICRV